jgi:hypothetical protein
MIIMGIALGVVGMVISKDRGSLEAKTFTKELSAVLRRARSNAVPKKRRTVLLLIKKKESLDYLLIKSKIKRMTGRVGNLTLLSANRFPKNLK